MTSPGETVRKRPNFPYLDGIRGAAAVAVVLLHAYLYTGFTGDAERDLPIIGLIVGWGWLGVPVFIVLSGYLLMGGVDAYAGYKLRRGLPSFVKSRARRILPPYFAALAISLALIALVPLLQTQRGTQWDTKVPFGTADIVSHLLLAQNFNRDWIGTINGPLWSVAVEWQIYFLMPLVLLPLWRRMKPAFLVSIVTVLTLIATFTGIGDYMHPWFLALGGRSGYVPSRAFRLVRRLSAMFSGA